MRLRRKKHHDLRLGRVSSRLCADPNPGVWPDVPLFVELGCGKGKFACGLAERNPAAMVVAVEKNPEALLAALERAESLMVPNICFIDGNASAMAEWFAPRSIGALHINFCDPWPKARHARRRLTHESFLRMYAGLLKPGGRLHFKTDNRPLYDFTVRSLAETGYTIVGDDGNRPVAARTDGHPPLPSITTDYEEKFMARGLPVYALEAWI
jgi:tRNA (guanine-N7-)-methyltransferase